MPLNLSDRQGQSMYLTAGEREVFLRAAGDAPREVRTFCRALLCTRHRISAALALTADRVDLRDPRIVLKRLARRTRGLLHWDWCQTTASSRVCEVIKAAGIAGPHTTPKGLRRGFVLNATVNNVSLSKVQKWLAHACLRTTSTYSGATAAEQDRIAEGMRCFHG